MFRCVAYNPSMKDEWDRLATARGTIFHTAAFRQILIDSFGYKCRYHAVVDSDNRIRALIPLIEGRNLGMKRAGVSLPFVNYMDICADNEEALRYTLECLTRLKDELRLGLIELRLKEQNVDSADWRSNLLNHTFVLPLEEDEEKVLALSSSSNRNHVRKVYKNNWFEASFDPGHLQHFYQVYVRRMKQLGSPSPDIRYFQRFFEHLPDHSHLLTVLDRETGDTVGGMLLLTSPGNSTLYYPYGANLIEYNNKYLNNFMYWEAAKFGIRNGLSNLDLGRSQAGSGTYKYKSQWGAKPAQLRYLVYDGEGKGSGAPDKESLSFFIHMWKIAPAFVTNGVGKRLIKYLMP